MIVIYCQHRNRLTAAERDMVASLRDQPGILLVNALVVNGRRTRELDGIWLHPTGLRTIEVKGTRLHGEIHIRDNGPWRIGNEVADFASGSNPLQQARSAAQALRHSLSAAGVNPGFIPASVAISGTGITIEARCIGDIAAVDTPALPQLLTLTRARALGQDSVRDVLRALDLAEEMPDPDELAGEGFAAGLDAAPPAPPPATQQRASRSTQSAPDARQAKSDGTLRTSRSQRRARRLEDLTRQAEQEWRRSNRRRLIASALCVLAVCGIVSLQSLYCLFNGLAIAAAVGAWQIAIRARKSGPRDSGLRAVLWWMLSLAPYIGIGSSLSWLTSAPAAEPGARPFLIVLVISAVAAIGCALQAGRSAFINPPAVVIERYDEAGRPTGAFMLAHTQPVHRRGRDWRPVDDTDQPT